jgi:hypothetical protein
MVGFGLIAVGIRWLNEARPVDVGALFPVHGRTDWPHGVQEADAPRFRIDHVNRIRRSAATVEDLPGAEATNPPRERVALRVHRFAPDR